MEKDENIMSFKSSEPNQYTRSQADRWLEHAMSLFGASREKKRELWRENRQLARYLETEEKSLEI